MDDRRDGGGAQTATNLLLASIPAEELDLLDPHLEQVELTFEMSLYEAGQPIDTVYFIDSGVASLIAALAEGDPVEVGTVGSEGMVGVPIVLAAEHTSSRGFIQIVGHGRRMPSAKLRELLPRCPQLHRLLLRYALALMNMMAQTAACNRAHEVEQRCARWLLMTHDRVHAPSFELTQEFLARMLGVRRPTVSIAAGILAKAQLITYTRGRVTIVDREGLEDASCECYQAIRREFSRLLGSG